jgi:hypothetical protein
VRDLVFVFGVLVFFAASVLFVRGCELVVGPGSTHEEQQR